LSDYLLDTNVVSEFDRPRPNRGVLEWFAACNEESLYLSVLTVGEIQRGIARLRDAVKQAKLASSLSGLRLRFRGRILAIDESIAERWGRLTGELMMDGARADVVDSLIGATALRHDLTVVTRNDAHFRFPGLTIINPFTAE
jgi:predicted nucleic acid-binding protein